MRALVIGGNGFIGGHLVRKLKSEGFQVAVFDIKPHDYRDNGADVNLILDARIMGQLRMAVQRAKPDHIYQLAADMGGAGFVFTGAHDADIMRNSCSINLNVLNAILLAGKPYPRVFYSSSACVYPRESLTDGATDFKEKHAYPALPDNDYGWEKLFSERVYLAHFRNYGIPARVARFHNIYGPFGTWCGGREKSIAAMCRKVAEAPDGGSIEIWGDGSATRSFLYVEDCVETIRKFVDSEFTGPLNIGSDYKISMKDLCETIIRISGKKLEIRSIPGPVGVQNRNSENSYIKSILGFAPDSTRERLEDGLAITFNWINEQVAARKK